MEKEKGPKRNKRDRERKNKMKEYEVNYVEHFNYSFFSNQEQKKKIVKASTLKQVREIIRREHQFHVSNIIIQEIIGKEKENE